jgi:hypothetical protein
LHDRSALAGYAVFASDRGAKPHEFVDGIRVWIHQVDVNAVLRLLPLP